MKKLNKCIEPSTELEKLLTVAPCVIFSTLLIPRPTPGFDDWWYYGKEHGQHIGFFRVETLKILANRNNKQLTTDGKFYHMIADYKINKFSWICLIKLSRLLRLIASFWLQTKHFQTQELVNK